MSARHGVADTGEFRQREGVAATKKIRKRVLPLRRKFVKEGECVLRQRIYRFLANGFPRLNIERPPSLWEQVAYRPN